MNQLEKQLLNEQGPGGTPTLTMRSKTRIDVGRWWRPRRVWLCIVNDELVMLAAARRQYIARKPLMECQATYYCHATGQLVIQPGEELTFSRFKLSPRQALDLLTEIKS